MTTPNLTRQLEPIPRLDRHRSGLDPFLLLVLLCAWMVQACGAAFKDNVEVAHSGAESDSPPEAKAASPGMEEHLPREAGPVAVVQATAASARPDAPPERAAAAPQSAPPAPQPTPTAATQSAATSTGEAASQTVLAEARKMVDIEARLSVEVEDTAHATKKARALANASGGQIVAENIVQQAGMSRAELTLRVPASAAGDFLASLDAIGVVRTRQVIAKDIGKEFYDAAIRLENLEIARRRYEEILAQAKTVEESCAWRASSTACDRRSRPSKASCAG